jgi:uncharacterized protein YoaH (UPF0181 family)
LPESAVKAGISSFGEAYAELANQIRNQKLKA